MPIVPTVLRSHLEADDIRALFDELEQDEIVIKPPIGANATGAFKLDRRRARFARAVAGRGRGMAT